MTDPLFHVVLHEPQIPSNTGNIGRTCVAVRAALHLIHPLGFDLSEKACRRAGLDYWPRLDVREHDSWVRYLEAETPARLWLFSTSGARSAFDADFRPGDHLVFGKESAGLPVEILADREEHTLAFPMVESERSLNVATVVCAAVYEGVRQLIARGDLSPTPDGRLPEHTPSGGRADPGHHEL